MRTVLTKSEDGAFLIKKYLTFIGNFGPFKFSFTPDLNTTLTEEVVQRCSVILVKKRL